MKHGATTVRYGREMLFFGVFGCASDSPSRGRRSDEDVAMAGKRKVKGKLDRMLG